MDEQKQESHELSELEKKAEDYLNGWKRAQADSINYKKDEAKRLEEAIKFGNVMLMQDLLAVLDSFDLAIAALEKTGPLDRGVYMIKSQLTDALKKHGLERLVVLVGQVFDPALQETVAEIENSGSPPNTVVEEIGAGYILNGKLIRPAKIKVAK